jgi:hypothetical protein
MAQKFMDAVLNSLPSTIWILMPSGLNRGVWYRTEVVRYEEQTGELTVCTPKFSFPILFPFTFAYIGSSPRGYPMCNPMTLRIIPPRHEAPFNCIRSDLSNGRESVPIPLINEVDERVPPFFEYIRDSDMRYIESGAIASTRAEWFSTLPTISLPLIVFKTTNDCGFGVLCSVGIRKGTFIAFYVGEFMTQEHVERFGRNGSNYLYIVEEEPEKPEEPVVIDAGIKGNVARFINHSCVPNCIGEDTPIPGSKLFHIGIHASRDIAAWEELTIDYSWGGLSGTECKCGAETCKNRL